jgi:phosphomannomutase
MAAVFKAYGIRVFCLDRYSVAPFISFFTKKFKCLLGVMITGRDAPKTYNGLLIYNSKGLLISNEVSKAIEKTMGDFISSNTNLIDISPLYDYTGKKVKFKPDNFTDASLKSYIQFLEEKFLFN